MLKYKTYKISKILEKDLNDINIYEILYFKSYYKKYHKIFDKKLDKNLFIIYLILTKKQMEL